MNGLAGRDIRISPDIKSIDWTTPFRTGFDCTSAAIGNCRIGNVSCCGPEIDRSGGVSDRKIALASYSRSEI